MTDLERLMALEEIRGLAQRYAVYLDARDLDGLVELYVPDVRVTRESQGRDALRAQFDETLRSVGVTFLQVGNHVIDFQGDDEATGVVYTRGEIQDGGIDSAAERTFQQRCESLSSLRFLLFDGRLCWWREERLSQLAIAIELWTVHDRLTEP